MSATDEIRVSCDQPGRELRDALIRYSKENARAPYSIQADSMLYGDLVRHYLQWCAGLLAKMEEAAAARPAWKDAVAQLLGRSAAYFKETARRPSVPHLDHPLRLLVPACYAMRAARRVNSLLEPALVAVDFTEPNEFVTKLLGRLSSNKSPTKRTLTLERWQRLQKIRRTKQSRSIIAPSCTQRSVPGWPKRVPPSQSRRKLRRQHRLQFLRRRYPPRKIQLSPSPGVES
jgi:hypothetical protein